MGKSGERYVMVREIAQQQQQQQRLIMTINTHTHWGISPHTDTRLYIQLKLYKPNRNIKVLNGNQ